MNGIRLDADHPERRAAVLDFIARRSLPIAMPE